VFFRSGADDASALSERGKHSQAHMVVSQSWLKMHGDSALDFCSDRGGLNERISRITRINRDTQMTFENLLSLSSLEMDAFLHA
jgi:hypothetical protein